jgi:cold shock CspA family protein
MRHLCSDVVRIHHPEPDRAREQGTIVAWTGMGVGRIQSDRGDRVDLFYWSILQGFRQLTVGQRVEFLRVPFGANRHMATLVVPAESD